MRAETPGKGYAGRWRLASRLGPWQVVLVILLVYLGSVLSEVHWDPMALVRIGTRFDPGLADGSMGYDGQFSYQIAVSPLESPSKLDVAPYRLQRIVYPMVVRLVALGSRDAIPWALLAVNLAALVGGVSIMEALMQAHGQSRWWALAYGLNVGMLMATRLDLTEPLAYLLVQAGVLSWTLSRRWLSAAAFSIAALTKETTILILTGYLVFLLLRRGISEAVRWGAVALGPFLLWQVVLLAWLGRAGIGSGGALSTPFEIVPFRGWWSVAAHDPRGFVTLSILIVPLVILPTVAGLALAVRSLLSGLRGSSLALLIQSGMTLFLPMSNLVDPLGASRFMIGLVCALLCFGAEADRKRVLAYSQLWILTLAFVPGDRLLPSG